MLKLSTEVEGHNHIVYLRPTIDPESIRATGEGIIGMTSEDMDHQHEIWYSPEMVNIDPETGQEVVTPARIYMQEVFGHTHEIEMEYLQLDPARREKRDKDVDKEAERLQEYLRIAYRSWDNDESSYRPQGREAERLYYGLEEQWPEEIRKKLQDEARPMLTFNMIKPKINNIIGMFAANPLMPKIKPTEGSDARLADIYNALNAHTFAKCDFPAVQREVFSDQVITGRGNIDIKIDTSINPEGDPMIRHAQWDQVTYMPHNNKDLSDCEGMCQWEWVTKDFLKMIAPAHKREEVEQLATSSYIDNLAYPYGGSNAFAFNNIDNKTLKLMHVTRKEYKSRSVIFNPVDNYYLDGQEGSIPSWLLDAKTQKRILSIPDFEKAERIVTEYWVGTIGANILLYDRLSEFNGYLTIPSYATKRKGRIKGEVIDLKDPQFEKNKRQSLFIENLQKFAANVIITDRETFGGDEQLKNDFLSNRSRPGAVLEVEDINRVKELGPPRFPTELLTLSQLMGRDMDIISGFNNEGISGLRNATSTPLFRERRQAALMSLEYLFSNFNILLRQTALRLIEMYRALYTPDRVWRILENHNVKLIAEGGRGLMVNGIPFINYDYQAIKDIWDNNDQLRYDIAIDYSSYSTTKADDDFTTFATLGQQGVPGITAETLFELKTDLNPEVKERLIQIAQQAAQQQAQISQSAGQMEIQKVQIGQQGQNQRLMAQLQNDNAQFAANLALEQEKLDKQ